VVVRGCLGCGSAGGRGAGARGGGGGRLVGDFGKGGGEVRDIKSARTVIFETKRNTKAQNDIGEGRDFNFEVGTFDFGVDLSRVRVKQSKAQHESRTMCIYKGAVWWK
jgi:hypothetical protein